MHEISLFKGTDWAKKDKAHEVVWDENHERKYRFESGESILVEDRGFMTVSNRYSYKSLSLVSALHLDIIRYEERYFPDEKRFESVIILGVVPDTGADYLDYGSFFTAVYNHHGQLQQPINTDHSIGCYDDRSGLLMVGHLSVRDLPAKINFKRVAQKIIHQAKNKNFSNPSLAAR
ncbi:hypothetical protein HZA76_01070 [Candidatus Roizmanbacteria bacterium]|nr:hypothetical protein [Candidatus Roizmanbacteria bacterium]